MSECREKLKNIAKLLFKRELFAAALKFFTCNKHNLCSNV